MQPLRDTVILQVYPEPLQTKTSVFDFFLWPFRKNKNIIHQTDEDGV